MKNVARQIDTDESVWPEDWVSNYVIKQVWSQVETPVDDQVWNPVENQVLDLC